MIGNKIDNIIKEFFQLLLTLYQISLETNINEKQRLSLNVLIDYMTNVIEYI